MAKHLLFVAIVWTIAALDCKEACALDKNTVIQLGKHDYVRGDILEVDGDPYNFVGDIGSEDLYYTLVHHDFRPILYRVQNGTRESNEIEIGDAIAQVADIDRNSGAIFIGTDCGLYKIESDCGTPKFVGLGDFDIVDITLTDDGRDIYVTTFPHFSVYKYSFRKQTKRFTIPEAYYLVIDSKNNLYYQDESDHLRKLNSGKIKSNIYKHIRFGDDIKLPHSVGVDSSDNIYVSIYDAFYLVKDDGQLSFLGNLPFAPTDLLFDRNDNLIIGATNKIYSLIKVVAKLDPR